MTVNKLLMVVVVVVVVVVVGMIIWCSHVVDASWLLVLWLLSCC